MIPAPPIDHGVFPVVLVTPGAQAVDPSDSAETEAFWADLGRPQYVVERQEMTRNLARVSIERVQRVQSEEEQ